MRICKTNKYYFFLIIVVIYSLFVLQQTNLAEIVIVLNYVKGTSSGYDNELNKLSQIIKYYIVYNITHY